MYLGRTFFLCSVYFTICSCSFNTPGLNFWKCASRKVYAVKINSKSTKRPRGKTTSICYNVPDDSDEEFIPKKPTFFSHADFEHLKSQVCEIKTMVSDILEVNQVVSLPLGIVKLLQDAFMCKICHSTHIIPPVIATTCCNSLLGCESCVNNWYGGSESLSKKCPHCNEPRGYASIFQFKGMDEFLVGIKEAIGNDESHSD